jgi:hypothetical protein
MNMSRAASMEKMTSGPGPSGSSLMKVEIAVEKRTSLLGVLGLWLEFCFGVYAVGIL